MQIKKDTPCTSSQSMRLHLKSYVTFVRPDKAPVSSTQMAKDFLHICTIFMSGPDYFTYFIFQTFQANVSGVKKVTFQSKWSSTVHAQLWSRSENPIQKCHRLNC